MDDRAPTRHGAPRMKRVWPHKMWIELFRARRKLRRALKERRRLEEHMRVELKALTERYEEQLALERSRFSQMQTEWSSRLVQLAGLNPMLLTDLESSVTDPKYRAKPDDGLALDLLSESQHERYTQEKERFFTEGIEIGNSPAQVRERWKAVSEQVIEDIMT